MTRQAVRVGNPATARRTSLLTGVASALTLGGAVLAVVQPAWLITPLGQIVAGAGSAAPVV